MHLRGHNIAQYRIQDLLKRGGMAEIYLADDGHLHRRVAIKVIWTDSSHYEHPDHAKAATDLFLREARTLARFDHRHILPIFDSGVNSHNGLAFMYLVMPFYAEGSLYDWLQRYNSANSLTLWDCDRIVQQAAAALQYAHDMNIVHQDVKTSNFLVRGKAQFPSQLELKLADFGIAKFLASTTKSLEVRGTPHYMAPEQWDSKPLPATDQYALAVMVYELLAGRPPFLGDNKEQLWHQHYHAMPPLPSSFNSDIPATLDNVLFKALAKRPEQRYSSITDFAKAFRLALLNNRVPQIYNLDADTISPAYISNIEKTVPVPLPPLSTPDDVPPPSPRNRILPILALLLVLLIIGSSIFYFSFSNHSTSVTISPIPTTDTLKVKNTPNPSNPLTGTAHAQETNTAQVSATDTSLTATATANMQTAVAATSTAIATNTQIAEATQTAIASIYQTTVTSGTGPWSDPLQDNALGHNWDTASFPDGSRCTFSGQAYHAIIGQQRFIQHCFAQSSTFTNFSCETSITINTGTQGGIAFRGDESQGNFYYFYISTDHTFGLDTYSADIRSSTSLTSGVNLAIHPLSGKTYVLAVVAINSTFKLFVNETLLATITDTQNTYTQGNIGLVASANGSGNPTDISFTNIKVWGK